MTEQNNEDTRWEEIVEIWRSYPPLYAIAGFIVGILVFPAINIISEDILGLLENLVPEAFGIAFTVFLIDRIYRQYEQRKEITVLRQKLKDDARSSINSVALTAVDEIRRRGWHTGSDSLLRGLDLSGADLTGANLQGANLDDSTLNATCLRNANLSDCSLRNCRGTETDFENAEMNRLDLSDAFLLYPVFVDVRARQINANNLCMAHPLFFGSTMQFDCENLFIDLIFSHNSTLFLCSQPQIIGSIEPNELIPSEISDPVWKIVAEKYIQKPQIANLRDTVWFESGVLENSTINRKNWEGADLAKVSIHNTVFDQVRLRKAYMTGSTLIDCVFDNSNLFSCVLSHATLNGIVFDHVYGASAKLDSATVSNTVFDQVSLLNANLINAVFDNCTFSASTLTGTQLAGARLSDCTFTGVILSGCDLNQTTFVRCQFDSTTILPDNQFWKTNNDLRRFGAEIIE